MKLLRSQENDLEVDEKQNTVEVDKMTEKLIKWLRSQQKHCTSWWNDLEVNKTIQKLTKWHTSWWNHLEVNKTIQKLTKWLRSW